MEQAVILAAGQGSRLGEAVNGTPKCMLRIGGSTLIEHHVRVLRQVGIKHICVVVGYGAEIVKEVLHSDCVCVMNSKFAQTNSLYSLWLAQQSIQGPFMLMNCDVLAHPDVFWRLVKTKGNALAYDSGSGFDDEHMKVQISDGRLQTMSKQLPQSQVSGENVGILKFNKERSKLLFKEADRIIDSGRLDAWAPTAVSGIANRTTIKCVDVSDLPWVEIDFAEDHLVAEYKVWPAIIANSVKLDETALLPNKKGIITKTAFSDAHSLKLKPIVHGIAK